MHTKPVHILLARTDSIGDVVLTIPMASAIRRHFPSCTISFIGRTYTSEVIKSCRYIDRFVNWDDIQSDPVPALIALNADVIIHVFPDEPLMKAAAGAKVPMRIATAGRAASWRYATHRVWFSRKRSDLHESQLNHYLLRPLGWNEIPDLQAITAAYGIRAIRTVPQEIQQLIVPEKVSVILHPLSKGSAVNWGMNDFHELAALLPPSRFQVFITGTQNEGELIRKQFAYDLPHLADVTGKMNLGEFIAFISGCDALVAASTGPLHLAAALGIKAIGLYSPQRPIHPGRWAPVGRHAEVFVAESHPEHGTTLSIAPAEVARALMVFSEEKESVTR
jgi:ADP-heptose:LPS heptosyltransferase